MNKRLPFASLMAVSALLFTGCASTVSREDAEKFIEENYTSTETKQATVHTVTEVTKAEGIFAKSLKVGKDEKDVKDNVKPISKLDLSIYSADYFKFKTQGKKFIIEFDVKDIKNVMAQVGLGDSIPESAKFDGRASGKMIYDENGYPESAESSFNLSFEYSESGFTVEGALKSSEKATYTY